MSKVIQMSDHRPHLTIDTKRDDGQIHVYPVQYFLDFASGKEGLEPIPEAVMKHIVVEWLSCVHDHEEP